VNFCLRDPKFKKFGKHCVEYLGLRVE